MTNSNQQLITCQSKDNALFRSNNNYFIDLGWEMQIQNDRSKDDYAYLDSSSWSDMKKSIDGYPEYDVD